MKFVKYCNLNFLIKFSLTLIVISFLIWFLDNVDYQFLRGTLDVQTQQAQPELSSSQQQELVEQILNKQFNIE